jgi:predicted ATPase
VSTLIVAQPEIHLHPNVQAKLSDYFVRKVKNQNKRYIIETHSEYLLNRLRLLIVKGEIAADDVAVYYFENSKKGTSKHTIEFTKDGQIKNAPKGFFDTYMMDVMDIALQAE